MLYSCCSSGCLELSLKIIEKYFSKYSDLNTLTQFEVHLENSNESENTIADNSHITRVGNLTGHVNDSVFDSDVQDHLTKNNETASGSSNLMGVTPFTLTKKVIPKVSSLSAFEESSSKVNNSQNVEKDSIKGDGQKYFYEPSPTLKNKISWSLMRFVKPQNGNNNIALDDAKIPVDKALLSFITVIKRDNVTELQWPLEMIQLTNTEPKITFGCNPLDFDIAGLKKNSAIKSIADINVLTRNKVDALLKDNGDGEMKDPTNTANIMPTDGTLLDADKNHSKVKKHKKHKHKNIDGSNKKRKKS